MLGVSWGDEGRQAELSAFGSLSESNIHGEMQSSCARTCRAESGAWSV